MPSVCRETAKRCSAAACRWGRAERALIRRRGAHRAGADVVMVAGVGKDDFSNFAHRQFASEGLSEKYVAEMDEYGTGCALIEVDGQSGENRIVVVQGANAQLSRAHVRAAEVEIASADLVLTQLETNLEAVDELKRLAKKHGKTLVVNPAPFGPVPEGFFEGVDVFTPNETEAEYYSGLAVNTEADAAKAAEKMQELGVKSVVITMGSRGAYCAGEDECGMVESPVVKAVDTVGAGDAFTGRAVREAGGGKQADGRRRASPPALPRWRSRERAPARPCPRASRPRCFSANLKLQSTNEAHMNAFIHRFTGYARII